MNPILKLDSDRIYYTKAWYVYALTKKLDLKMKKILLIHF